LRRLCPSFRLLGVPQNLALDIFMGGKALPADVKKHLNTDPYLDASTYGRYYGGLQGMMPWVPNATPITFPYQVL
jgi:hypothetical protein